MYLLNSNHLFLMKNEFEQEQLDKQKYIFTSFTHYISSQNCGTIYQKLESTLNRDLNYASYN